MTKSEWAKWRSFLEWRAPRPKVTSERFRRHPEETSRVRTPKHLGKARRLYFTRQLLQAERTLQISTIAIGNLPLLSYIDCIPPAMVT